MSAPRVFFVNRFYWPDEPATAQLLGDLAAELVRAGHPVAVITSRPAGRAALRTEDREGVSIYRVRATHWGRQHVAGRVVDILSFQLGAVWAALRRVRRGDVLVSLTDPPLLGLLLWLVSALRGARLVHWVQDIYPEVAGPITQVLVAEGAKVHKGDLLLTIDDSVQRATTEQQRSQAEAAKALLEELEAEPRRETLAVAAAQVDNAQATLKNAQDQLANAQETMALHGLLPRAEVALFQGVAHPSEAVPAMGLAQAVKSWAGLQSLLD